MCLALIVLVGWAIRQKLNAKKEREKCMEVEKLYAAALTELERQALEFRSHFSGDIDLHTH